MAEFDQFAQEYQTILDDSLKLGGEKGDYFSTYKASYIARRIGKGFSGKILDYGCGVGLLSKFLVQHLPQARVHGFDVSPASIRCVPASLKQQGLFTCDVNALDSDYDLIVIANVLHHVQPNERKSVIARLKKLVSPTGNIIVFEHNPINPLTRKIVRESPLDKGVVLLPSGETLSYMQQAGLRRQLDYIVFFPKALSALRWAEPFLRWCPFGAQYAVIGQVENSHA